MTADFRLPVIGHNGVMWSPVGPTWAGTVIFQLLWQLSERWQGKKDIVRKPAHVPACERGARWHVSANMSRSL